MSRSSVGAASIVSAAFTVLISPRARSFGVGTFGSFARASSSFATVSSIGLPITSRIAAPSDSTSMAAFPPYFTFSNFPSLTSFRWTS
jgi:hypothetical protein